MIYHLEILKVIEIDFFLLQTEFVVKTGTVVVGISDPPAISQSMFEVSIASSHNENFLPGLQSVLLLPFGKISNMGEAPQLSLLFLRSLFFILFTIIFLILTLLLILTGFHRLLGLFIQLLIVDTIKYIFLHSYHNIILQLLFKPLFFLLFLFLLLLFFSSPSLDLFKILLIFTLEVFIGLRHLVFIDLDQRFEFVGRMATS
jgi:hypothetical protein